MKLSHTSLSVCVCVCILVLILLIVIGVVIYRIMSKPKSTQIPIQVIDVGVEDNDSEYPLNNMANMDDGIVVKVI
jgi:hypothetical protein